MLGISMPKHIKPEMLSIVSTSYMCILMLATWLFSVCSNVYKVTLSGSTHHQRTNEQLSCGIEHTAEILYIIVHNFVFTMLCIWDISAQKTKMEECTFRNLKGAHTPLHTIKTCRILCKFLRTIVWNISCYISYC